MRNGKLSHATRPPMPKEFYEGGGKTAGFIAVEKLIHYDPILSQTAKHVYTTLRGYGWRKSFSFPGQRRLSAQTGLSTRTLIRAIKELRERGLIHVTKHPITRRNTYHFVRPDKVYSDETIAFASGKRTTAEWIAWRASNDAVRIKDLSGQIIESGKLVVEDDVDVLDASADSADEVHENSDANFAESSSQQVTASSFTTGGSDTAVTTVVTRASLPVVTRVSPSIEEEKSSFGREEEEAEPREARVALPDREVVQQEFENGDEGLLGEVRPRGLKKKNPPTPLDAPRHEPSGSAVRQTTTAVRAKKVVAKKAPVTISPTVGAPMTPDEAEGSQSPFDMPTEPLHATPGVEPKKPPKEGSFAYGVYYDFVQELYAKWPDARYNVPATLGNDGRLHKELKQLDQRFMGFTAEGRGPRDVVHDVIRVLVWDWESICNSDAFRYVKGANARPGIRMPDVVTLCRLADLLVGQIGVGVTTVQQRTSDYVQRYVKPAQATTSSEPESPSAAAAQKFGMTRAALIRWLQPIANGEGKTVTDLSSEILAGRELAPVRRASFAEHGTAR